MDLSGLFALAFGLGLLHALDADHIAAVSGMASHRAGLKSSVQFCLRWALGHGTVLLIVAGAVFLLGMAIPDDLSALAEQAVGAVLIGIGAMIFHDLYRKRAHIHFHRHDHLPEHAHWHTHNHPCDASGDASGKHDDTAHRHPHTATMVGALHGMAGSAPLLLLLPLGQMTSPWQGVLYLLVFSIGVVMAMLLFGGVLGVVFAHFAHLGSRFIQGFRAVIGLMSIGYGGYLLAF